jgi:hypothetical protein
MSVRMPSMPGAFPASLRTAAHLLLIDDRQDGVVKANLLAA